MMVPPSSITRGVVSYLGEWKHLPHPEDSVLKKVEFWSDQSKFLLTKYNILSRDSPNRAAILSKWISCDAQRVLPLCQFRSVLEGLQFCHLPLRI